LVEVGKSGGEERHFGGKSGDEQRHLGLQALAAHVDGEAVCCTDGGGYLHEDEERLVGAPAVDAEPISSLDRSRDGGVDDSKTSWADGLDDCTGLAVEEAKVEEAAVHSAVLVADGVVRVQAWWRGLRDRAAIEHAGCVRLNTRQWRCMRAAPLLVRAARYDKVGRPWWRRLARVDDCSDHVAATCARATPRPCERAAPPARMRPTAAARRERRRVTSSGSGLVHGG
jgi:hypothetical protein